MDKIDIDNELNSDLYKVELERLVEMREAVAFCLSFCFYNSLRDGVSGDRNFFLRMIDDILQSAISIEALAKQGIVNTCRRELRYLIELSIKSCFIVKNTVKQTFEEQIDEYEKLLNSSNINPINTLTLEYFNGDRQEEFKTEVKRMYGYLCNYTHASTHQVTERLRRLETGRSIGFEGIDELKELNNDVEKVYAMMIVMMFHSVAPYVVSDFLVEGDGKTIDWYFTQYKYISLIDETFDY